MLHATLIKLCYVNFFWASTQLFTRACRQDRNPLITVTPVPEELEKRLDESHSALRVEEMTEEQAKAELLKALL